MAYTYDSLFAVDPNSPNNIARNASILLFDPNDPAKTPVTLTDVTGSPVTNPIQVNQHGFGPAIKHPTLDRLAWEGAGMSGVFTSYEGMKEEAVAAREAAEAAAGDAAAAAQADLEARIASGVFKGDKGADGSNVLPTDTAIKNAITTPGTETATALNATFARIAGLPAASGGDDTAALNAVLSAAPAGYTVRGSVGSVYKISAPLIVKSDQTLDMRGCTITAATTQHEMVRNAAAVATLGTPTTGNGAIRDKNVRIIGGTWTTGATDGNKFRIFMHQVDGVSVTDLAVNTVNGKYAVFFADVTDFRAERLSFTTASDGVHVTGPASRGYIADITGTTGDDSVALGCTDYSTYDYSRGNISDVVVERVKTTTVARAVLAFCIGHTGITGPYSIRRLTLRDINSAANQGIQLHANAVTPNATGVIDDILISGVTNTSASINGMIGLGGNQPGSYIGNVTVNGLATSAASTNTGRAYGVNIDCTDVRSLTAQMNLTDSTGRENRGIFLLGASKVRSLNLTATSNFTVPTSTVIHQEGTSTIEDLRLAGNFKGGAVLNVTTAGATLTRATIAGAHVPADSANNSYAITFGASTASDLHFAGFTHLNPGNLGDRAMNVVGTTANVRISGDLITDHSGGAIRRGVSTAIIRMFSPTTRVELASVPAVAGGMAYATNTAAAPGAVVSDGTLWKNLITGTTYTPPA